MDLSAGFPSTHLCMALKGKKAKPKAAAPPKAPPKDEKPETVRSRSEVKAAGPGSSFPEMEGYLVAMADQGVRFQFNKGFPLFF